MIQNLEKKIFPLSYVWSLSSPRLTNYHLFAQVFMYLKTHHLCCLCFNYSTQKAHVTVSMESLIHTNNETCLSLLSLVPHHLDPGPSGQLADEARTQTYPLLNQRAMKSVVHLSKALAQRDCMITASPIVTYIVVKVHH